MTTILHVFMNILWGAKLSWLVGMQRSEISINTKFSIGSSDYIAAGLVQVLWGFNYPTYS